MTKRCIMLWETDGGMWRMLPTHQQREVGVLGPFDPIGNWEGLVLQLRNAMELPSPNIPITVTSLGNGWVTEHDKGLVACCSCGVVKQVWDTGGTCFVGTTVMHLHPICKDCA